MSSSPRPLAAEEWNYPPLCAHTSFLLQMTSFPLWNWHPQFILISLLSTGRTRAPCCGVPAMAINRVSRHGLANAAHSHWGNPSEASRRPERNVRVLLRGSVYPRIQRWRYILFKPDLIWAAWHRSREVLCVERGVGAGEAKSLSLSEEAGFGTTWARCTANWTDRCSGHRYSSAQITTCTAIWIFTGCSQNVCCGTASTMERLLPYWI